jgi:hypothetical protein
LGRTQLGLLFLVTLFLIACEEPNEIGLELTGDPDRIGAYYQEIEISTSLINNDSTFTLSVPRLLTGNTYKQEFGQFSAKSFTQYGFSTAKLEVPEDAVYDSLVLYVSSDYAYGTGISGIQRFTVHELTEDLYDTAEYFSFSSAEYDPNPIGTGDFMLPEREDTVLSFKIDDVYGNRLFEAAQDTNSIDPEDVSTLHALFKGFAFVSDAGNNSVLGINASSDSTFLTLYFTVDTVKSSYPFQFFGVANFNQFLTDRTGSPLDGIEDQHYQDFFPDNEKSYIQSGADLVTKLDFTPMLNFFDTIEYATINQTVISINIDEPDFNELPPSYLYFYYHDENNKRIKDLGQFLGILQDGSTDLQRALLDEENLLYEAPITIFSDRLIKGIYSDTTVLMYPPEFGITNTVNQFMVSPGKIVLQIHYSKIK